MYKAHICTQENDTSRCRECGEELPDLTMRAITEARFRILPKPVGGYRMGNTLFYLNERPPWWHRLGVRLVLGWIWEDEPTDTSRTEDEG